MTPIDPSYCEITLTQGQVARVSCHQHARLMSKTKWHASWNKSGQSWYARRNASRQEIREGSKGSVYMHKEIVGLSTHDKMHCDHRDGNTLNNVDTNLRVATKVQDARNRRKLTVKTSKYKGVSLNAGRWIARIGVDYRQRHLGYFPTELEAYSAYCRAAIELFGDFAPDFTHL